MRHKAVLWEGDAKGSVHCYLCAHQCRIREGGFGICGMRQNEAGELFTFAYGEVIANHVDPIEKKPFYHFLPGSTSYSIATIGCNFRCGFCQNWAISQLSRRDGDHEGYELAPEEVVREAAENGCGSISYTYTEPTVFFEYAYDTAVAARKKGLKNTFVTNGYMTKEAIDKLDGCLDAANVDLKFFKEDSYRQMCAASLAPVLGSIRNLKKKGIWIEVTTLLIPGKNDSDEELRSIARFLAETGRDIPWHISRFHPGYKAADIAPTPVRSMERAREIGIAEGLKYVYLGNVEEGGDTLCPACGAVAVKRSVFFGSRATRGVITGKCGKCAEVIEGVWERG